MGINHYTSCTWHLSNRSRHKSPDLVVGDVCAWARRHLHTSLSPRSQAVISLHITQCSLSMPLMQAPPIGCTFLATQMGCLVLKVWEYVEVSVVIG